MKGDPLPSIPILARTQAATAGWAGAISHVPTQGRHIQLHVHHIVGTELGPLPSDITHI